MGKFQSIRMGGKTVEQYIKPEMTTIILEGLDLVRTSDINEDTAEDMDW